MNKRTFVVELTSENDSLNALTKEDFDYIMRRGLYEYMGNFFAQNVQIKNVEQNVERLKNQDKMLDLLERASERLHDYAIDFTSGNSDSLAAQIDEFLDGEQ
jgi:hypothetical protein